MARRIRWQILIAAVSAALVLGLMSYLALTTAAVAQPLPGGVFTEYETSQPTQLNPLVVNLARDPVAADLGALLFDGLMRTGADGLPEPALAASLPAVDESGTVYTFTLRPDVTWHDGQPLTVDDALWTLRAVQSPGFVGDQVTGGVWENVLLEQIDDRSFRATLPAPLASFVSYATFPILPEHLLGDVPPEEWATTAFNQQPVGTGPYRMSGPITSDQALLLANPNYFLGRPYLDSIDLRFNQNPPDALAVLSRGEAVGFGLSSTSEQSRVNTPRGATRHAIPLAAYTTLTFNLREEPLSDQALRRALALAVDRDALIERVLDGQGQRLDTPILPGWRIGDPQVTARYDTTAASDALTSLGYEVGSNGQRARDGQPLTLSILTDDAPERAAAAQEIVRQWAEIGVQAEIEQVSAEQLEERLQSHQFTVALHSWQRQGPDPDVVFALWHSSGAEGGFNYAGLEDAEIDEQLVLGRELVMRSPTDTETFEQRIAAYSAFQRRWLDLAPGVTLYQPLYLYTVAEELSGLGLDPQQSDSGTLIRPLLLGREDRFRSVADWYLRSGREIQGDLRQNP